MSWGRWLGSEPAEVTTYEYDDDGRLIRSTTVRESEWDDESRAYAEALVDLEQTSCPGCGQPLDECLSDRHPPGTEPFTVYQVDKSRCLSCTAIDIEREQLAKGSYRPRGVHLTVRRKEATDG